MANFNGLEIHQIDEILNGGGISYGTTYISAEKDYTNKTISRFIDLGWTKKFLMSKFRGLNDALLDYWTTDLFIKTYIGHIVDVSISMDGLLFNNLRKIGLRVKVAKHLDYLFTPINNTCYTDKQIVCIAVEHLLGKNAPISSPLAKHYLRPEVLNAWFTVDTIKYKLMNIPNSCSSNLAPHIQASISCSSDSTLYFHTTNWSSSRKIFKGIKYSYGRPCLDFGLDPGFYMSDKLEHSLEWGQKISRFTSNEICMFIFELPKIFPKSLKFKHLVGEEWTSVTKKSRQCKSDDVDNPEIENCGLIYGNMVANPNAVINGVEPQHHVPPKTQLVGKNDVACNFVHKRIVGCIYFQKYDV